MPKNIVLTLDCSGSMTSSNYFAPAQTDTATFTNIMSTGDSIGLVGFSDNAFIFFPVSGASQMVAIQGQPTLDSATQAIMGQRTLNMTNISDAIAKSHGMLASSSTPRAIVLLSDGYWNVGPNPLTNLPTDIPIHTIALGPNSDTNTLQQIAYRTVGQGKGYHYAPTAWELAEMYNSIVQTTGVSRVALNSLQQPQSFAFKRIPVTVSPGNEQAHFSLAWLNRSVVYTAGTPTGMQVNVSVRDPSGNPAPVQSTGTGPGFVVLTVTNPVAGVWQIGVWTANTGVLDSVAGGFEPSSSTELDVGFESDDAASKRGDPLRFVVKITHDGSPAENFVVEADRESPLVSFEDAIEQHADALGNVSVEGQDADTPSARLAILHRSQLPSVDILPRAQAPVETALRAPGELVGTIDQTEVAGPYTVRVSARGRTPDGKYFSRVARLSANVLP